MRIGLLKQMARWWKPQIIHPRKEGKMMDMKCTFGISSLRRRAEASGIAPELKLPALGLLFAMLCITFNQASGIFTKKKATNRLELIKTCEKLERNSRQACVFTRCRVSDEASS
eukprot:199415-Pelagomonas_calceolata.AAC.1